MGKKFALFMISFVFGISAFMVAPAQTEASVTKTVKCIYLINKVKGKEAELERRTKAYSSVWYSNPQGPNGIEHRASNLVTKEKQYKNALQAYEEAVANYNSSCGANAATGWDLPSTGSDGDCDFEKEVWNNVAQNVADSIDPKKGFDGNGMAEALAGTQAETIPAAIDQMGQNHANLGGCTK